MFIALFYQILGHPISHVEGQSGHRDPGNAQCIPQLWLPHWTRRHSSHRLPLYIFHAYAGKFEEVIVKNSEYQVGISPLVYPP